MLQLARSVHASVHQCSPLTTIEEVQFNNKKKTVRNIVFESTTLYKFKDKIKLWRGLGLPILMQFCLGKVVFSLDIG